MSAVLTTPRRAGGTTALQTVRDLRARSTRRVSLVLVGLAVLLVLGMGVRVLLGGYTVAIPDFFAILAGERIEGAAGARFIVLQEKLPRAVAAALAGAALGASGALFRRTLRNPLASPDILGVTQGAAAAAVLVLAAGGVRGAGMAVAALIGGLAVTAAVLLVSMPGRSSRGSGGPAGGGLAGALGGQRFIVAGIAVAALGQAVVASAMLALSQHDLQAAAVWTAGSLNAVTWERIGYLAVTAAVLLPVGAALHAALSPSDLGSDLAHGLGSRPGRTGLGALGVGALLAAAATAATGPLAFVALLSTPIARGLTGGRASLPAAALTGAVIVVLADFLAAEALGGVRLPTGVLTGAAGAPLMLWLLMRTRMGAR